MYKIEMHLHTIHSSPCGHVDADTIARLYAEAGYAGIAVTDHYFNYTCSQWSWNIPFSEFFKKFTEGYELLREAAKPYGLKIYRGAEVRFNVSTDDYLLYHYPDELLQDPEAVFNMGLENFYPLCQQAGAVLVQAHPYRGKCTPADPRFLDGVEVYNLKARSDSASNDLALGFAEENPQLLRLSGSDFHNPEDAGRGGIIAPYLPENDAQLAQLLRSGNFEPISIA